MKLLIQREYIICRWIENGCTASGAQWHGLTVLKHSSMLLRPTSHRKVSCSVHAAFAEIKRSSQEDILYMSTFLKRVSWITILFGPSTVKLEFQWKTMKKIMMMITSQTGLNCMKRVPFKMNQCMRQKKYCRRTTTT